MPERACWNEVEALASLNGVLDLAIVSRSVYTQQIPSDATAVVENALDRIAGLFQQPSFHDALLRTTNVFRYYMWIVAALRHTGRLGEPTSRIQRRMLDVGYADLGGSPRSTYDALELQYILDINSFERLSLGSSRHLYKNSVLNATVNPVYISDEVAYEITHIILFLSDMGSRPVKELTEPERSHASEVIDELLGLYTCAENWDLTSELMLCRQALQSPVTPLASFAQSALYHAQLQSGALPGPAFDPKLARSLAGERLLDYTFKTCNHATLAATLCAAATCESAAHD